MLFITLDCYSHTRENTSDEFKRLGKQCVGYLNDGQTGQWLMLMEFLLLFSEYASINGVSTAPGHVGVCGWVCVESSLTQHDDE